MKSNKIFAGTEPRARRSRLWYVIPPLIVAPVAAAAVFAVLISNTDPTITLSPQSLATIKTPFGTGRVERVAAVGGREQKDIPVTLRGDQVWPDQKIAQGERITVVATVRRPGWISWLAGKEQRVTVTEVAPVAQVASTFITRAAGQPLTVRFKEPVREVGSGAPGSTVDPRTLPAGSTELTIPASAAAGTIAVAAAVRPWETPKSTTVSWFPRARGAKRATVVATPRPGSTVMPSTPIELTFSKPVSEVLGKARPPVNPTTPGRWHSVNSHTIVFDPTGYGYGLSATVHVLLPASVQLVGDRQAGTATVPNQGGNSEYPVVGSWTVPSPSTEVLQELLAELGYLPVNFKPEVSKQVTIPPVATKPPTKPPVKQKPKPTSTTTTVTTTATTTTAPTTSTQTTTPSTVTTTTTATTNATDTTATTSSDGASGITSTPTDTTTTTTTTSSTPDASAASASATTLADEEDAVLTPIKGKFSWRYKDTPSLLKHLWSPTRWTELTKGAVMAFEENEGLTVDGDPGPSVWKALLNAVLTHQRSNFGYTFVMVSEHVPESVRVWHNGKIVVQGLANTGIPAAPTATGTYAVYEHLRVTTMSGLNPNGTPYHDPGIPWVSYFNGGDALHGFIRASYGFPQSLGCVEMPFSEAAQVWPYTPIGTIVNLTPA